MHAFQPHKLLSIGLGAALLAALPIEPLHAQVSTLSWTNALQPVPVVTGARDLQVADLDLDGDGDILVLRSADVAVIENKGFGFSLEQSLAAGPFDFQLRTADLDQDGDLDLVVGSDPGITVYKNTGAGINFTAEPIGLLPTIDGFELGDMNGDGYPDLLFTEAATSQFQWYPNDSTGAFSPVLDTVLRAATGQSITLVDLDTDGDLDVVATTNAPNTITRYLNPGNGDLSNQAVAVNFILAQHIRGIDIDSNSLADLTSFEGDKLVQYIQAGPDSFAVRRTVALDVSNPSDLAVGDVDADGKQDIVASAEGVISYWLASSLGTFSSFEDEVVVDSIDGVQRILLADFEGDGDPDLWAIAGPEQRVFLYKAENDDCDVANKASNLQQSFTLDSLILTWDPPVDAFGCRAEGSKVVGSGFRGLDLVLGPGPHQSGVRLTALQPATDYMWRVRCVCSIFPIEAGSATPNDTFATPLPRMAADLPEVPARVLGQDAQRILDWGQAPSGELRWEIIDLTGRIVQSGWSAQQQVPLDLGALPAGSYWLNAEDGEGQALLPLVLTQR
jgi:hypothetical protein